MGKTYRNLAIVFFIIGIAITLFVLGYYVHYHHEYCYSSQTFNDLFAGFMIMGLPELIIACCLVCLLLRERKRATPLGIDAFSAEGRSPDTQIHKKEEIDEAGKTNGHLAKPEKIMAKYSRPSLRISLLSILFYLLIFPPLVAMILSIFALREIKTSGYTLGGTEQALSALVIGGVFLAFSVVYWVAVVAGVGWARVIFGLS